MKRSVDWSVALQLNKQALVQFANGTLPKNSFYEQFTYSPIGGDIRNMLRTKGTAASRQLVRRALRRHGVNV